MRGKKVLMSGNTFKENCTDISNTIAIGVYEELKSYNSNVDVYDPWASAEEVKDEFGITPIANITDKQYHSVILTVAHKEYLELDLKSLLVDEGVLYDVKGVLPLHVIDARL